MKNEEIVKKVKDEAKKQASKKVSMSEEEAKLSKDCFDAASMPVDFTDDDFKLGAQELDIRKLSKENLIQMFFRLQAVQTSQFRQLTQILIDVERLIMVLLTTKGVGAKDIGNRINELVNDLLEEQNKNTKA